MKQNGKWGIKASTSVYSNGWMEVIHDDVVRPDGKDGLYGVIKLKTGVTALPIDDEGNVYLIDEFRYPVRMRTIETMGAGAEEGEDPIVAAKREVKEELGITGKKWTDLGVSRPLTAFVDSPQHMFLVQDLSFGEQHLDGAEDINVLKLSLKEAVEKVMNGEITEQRSCLVILKVARMFNV